jgi:hypothetical protein
MNIFILFYYVVLIKVVSDIICIGGMGDNILC